MENKHLIFCIVVNAEAAYSLRQFDKIHLESRLPLGSTHHEPNKVAWDPKALLYYCHDNLSR